MLERETIEEKYDEFFGTGYWEREYKKHIVEFAFQCSNSIKLPVIRSVCSHPKAEWRDTPWGYKICGLCNDIVEQTDV